jgi:hypothetical protein
MIWHLRRKDALSCWDVHVEFVVRASTASEARELARAFVHEGHEQYYAACMDADTRVTRGEITRMATDEDVWLNETLSTAAVVSEIGGAQVITNYFRHG